MQERERWGAGAERERETETERETQREREKKEILTFFTRTLLGASVSLPTICPNMN